MTDISRFLNSTVTISLLQATPMAEVEVADIKWPITVLKSHYRSDLPWLAMAVTQLA